MPFKDTITMTAVALPTFYATRQEPQLTHQV